MIEKTKSDIALSSRACFEIVLPYVQKTVIIEEAFFKDLSYDTHETLDRSSPESLIINTVVFSGEGFHADAIKKWWVKVRVLNVYGQAECAPRAIINDSATTPAEVTRIGRGHGQKTWIEDPRDHNKLVPFGCVGELLLEGPQVGRGYLGDPERTAVSFIHDPVWLIKGPPGGAGRSGRLYKTGDLVQADQNGMLTLIGRKDAQVKIRGQRVELGEVEHHILESIDEAVQVVAEVIVPSGDGASPMLAAFLVLDNAAVHNTVRAAKIHHITADSQKRFRDSLPVYMTPTVLFYVAVMSKTVTNKINRRRLREMGSVYSVQELAEMRTQAGGPKREPKKPIEKHLHVLWSRILNLKPSSIGLGDSFAQLGGDSISAMILSRR
ncbi:putative secondary metabolism biosynthetic enzyme [Trichoderma virens FT-333]|nr:putative secondary metabolism biosynthetic enzyme [Trichoderma virens FT-333]